MNYAHPAAPRDVPEGVPQLFAVPVHAVADADARDAMWLWWGDAYLVDCSRGFFVVHDDGTLDFEARSDSTDDGAAAFFGEPIRIG